MYKNTEIYLIINYNNCTFGFEKFYTIEKENALCPTN